jgi:hypothetical protein
VKELPSELISEIARLLEEMTRIRAKLYWCRDCPIEVLLRLDDLIGRTEELLELCLDNPVDITSLRERYERLRKSWSKFLIESGLGIIYI